jgi:transcriptional regulator with XRE-family HTH domain
MQATTCEHARMLQLPGVLTIGATSLRGTELCDLAKDTTKLVVSLARQSYESRSHCYYLVRVMPRKTDIRQIFQRRLKEARERKQLSQKELGIQAGLDQFVASTRINRYELGVHEPDMAMIERMAQALNVPVSYLFADDERLARMILAFSQLSITDKDRLLKDIEPKS